MIDDAIWRRVLKVREEEPETVRHYIREQVYREEVGLPKEDPKSFFKTPAGWEAPQEAQEVFDDLSGGWN